MFPLADGLILPSAPGGRPVRWAATGRSGGVSRAPFDALNLAGYVGDDPRAVMGNRALVARLLGLGDDDIAIMDSVHGADVAVAVRGGVHAGVDGLVTQEPGLAVVALGADCVPIGIAGTDGRTVAAAHCGWRGLAVDVIGAVVAVVRELGADVGSVILGPAVCGHCYPVPVERSDEVRGRVSAQVSAAALVIRSDGQPGIDVRAGAVARLHELGVAPSAMSLAGGCTVEDPALFSYRRDGRTGRQGLAICTQR